VAAALENGEPRIAREGWIGAGALAEREGRAAGVAHDPLVNAVVAESGGRLRHAPSIADGGRRSAGPLPLLHFV
jgi:hypothetical protein